MKLTQITGNLKKLESRLYDVYFSYETPIAINDHYNGSFYVSENVWSRTTAKHINQVVQQGAEKIPNEMFESYFKSITG